MGKRFDLSNRTKELPIFKGPWGIKTCKALRRFSLSKFLKNKFLNKKSFKFFILIDLELTLNQFFNELESMKL